MINSKTLKKILYNPTSIQYDSFPHVQNIENPNNMKKRIKLIAKQYDFQLPNEEYYTVLFKHKNNGSIRLISHDFFKYLFFKTTLPLANIKYFVSLMEEKPVVSIYDDNKYDMKKLELYENGERIFSSGIIKNPLNIDSEWQYENDVAFNILKKSENGDDKEYFKKLVKIFK